MIAFAPWPRPGPCPSSWLPAKGGGCTVVWMGNGESLGDGLRTAGTATRQEIGRDSETTPQGVMDFAPVVITTQFLLALALACQMAKSESGWGELKLRGVVSGQSRCHSAVTRCSTIQVITCGLY